MLRRRRVRLPLVVRHSWTGGIAAVVLVIVLLVALLGPLAAPESPSALVGIPYSTPSGDHPFGLDFLGRDVLSRVLWGGRRLVALAALATAGAYVVGGSIGLAAGYRRARSGGILMRGMDALLAFPPILILLLIAAGAGASTAALVLGVILLNVPGVARVIYAATMDVSGRGYVAAAVVRGERTTSILTREILPNIGSTIAADAGPRLTISILLIASMNFLGFGMPPPAADWALMISENRFGLTVNPWTVAVPVILIAVLTIAVNLLADAIATAQGRSLETIRR